MAISKVGVVGGGLMGHGIAQICAQAGWNVVLREVDDDAAAKAVGKIEKQLGAFGGSQQTEPLDPGHPVGPGAAQGHVTVGFRDGEQHDRAADLLTG